MNNQQLSRVATLFHLYREEPLLSLGVKMPCNPCNLGYLGYFSPYKFVLITFNHTTIKDTINHTNHKKSFLTTCLGWLELKVNPGRTAGGHGSRKRSLGYVTPSLDLKALPVVTHSLRTKLGLGGSTKRSSGLRSVLYSSTVISTATQTPF